MWSGGGHGGALGSDGGCAPDEIAQQAAAEGGSHY